MGLWMVRKNLIKFPQDTHSLRYATKNHSIDMKRSVIGVFTSWTTYCRKSYCHLEENSSYRKGTVRNKDKIR